MKFNFLEPTFGPFRKSNMHPYTQFLPRPARKELNVLKPKDYNYSVANWFKNTNSETVQLLNNPLALSPYCEK